MASHPLTFTTLFFGKKTIYLSYILEELPKKTAPFFIHPAEVKIANTFKNYQRKKEFLSSRYLFHFISSSKEPLLRNEDRSPYFPSPWKGSISHKNNLLILAAQKNPSCKRIGIDIESTKIPNSILKRITSDEERALLQKKNLLEIEKPSYHALFFSCKESIYKCYNTIIKEQLNFEKIQISNFSKSDQTWSAKLSLKDSSEIRAKGFFKFINDKNNMYVMTYTEF